MHAYMWIPFQFEFVLFYLNYVDLETMDPIVLDSDSEEEALKKVPYLPPCRVCASPASGFHYGKLKLEKHVSLQCLWA